MGKKRHKAEEIVAKLRQVEVLTGQNLPRFAIDDQVQVLPLSRPGQGYVNQTGIGFLRFN